MDHEALKKEKSILMNMYGLFGAAIILSVLPHVAAAVLSLIFFSFALIRCYALRKKAEHASLIENHMSYLIRTFWISALIAFVTMIAAGIYLFSSIDPMAFYPCAEPIIAHAQEMAEKSDIALLASMSQPCMANFLEANRHALMAALAIAAVPVLLYVGYRFAAGLSRASKGYRMANPKGWL